MAAAALLADGIDLINENDAGGFFLCLVEQIANLGSAHAHEHFYKFRAGNGEEGHICFARNCLCQHGLAGSGRAHQQDPFGHGSTDGLIFTGVMQVIDDFLKIVLGFVLACHIGKADAAVGRGDIDLGIAVAQPEHHGIGPAAHLFDHLLIEELAEGDKKHDRQDPCQEKAHQRGGLLHNLGGELGAGGIQTLGEVRVVHHAGLVDILAVFICEKDLVAFDLHLADLALFGHGHKGAVVHFLDLLPGQKRQDKGIEHHKNQQDDAVIVNKRFLWGFDFFHGQFLRLDSLGVYLNKHLFHYILVREKGKSQCTYGGICGRDGRAGGKWGMMPGMTMGRAKRGHRSMTMRVPMVVKRKL